MEPTISPKEHTYFGICLVISVLVYAAIILSILGISYLLVFAFAGFVAQGLLVGGLRGNAIRVSHLQFPEVDALARDLATRMGLEPVPAVYVLQSGGMLNAFATRFLGRNFVVIYSDVLELAYQQGEAALAFVVAHELAHIKRGHLVWQLFLAPAMFTPFLGTAYSRACEYTCDRFGAFYRPDGAVSGLLVLAAGKQLHGRVSADALSDQAVEEGGFWVWFAEKLATHPNLPKRVRAVMGLGATVPARAVQPQVEGA